MRSDRNADARSGAAVGLHPPDERTEPPRYTRAARDPAGTADASDTPVSGALEAGEAEMELRGVTQRYRSGDRETLALKDIDLGIRRQEFVALVGQSGCGKTTMLRILAGLIKPTTGEVTVARRPLWDGDRRDDDALRKLGLVFQDANLFPWYTVEDNIGLPLLLRSVDKTSAAGAPTNSASWSACRASRRRCRASSRAACASASPSPGP